MQNKNYLKASIFILSGVLLGKVFGYFFHPEEKNKEIAKIENTVETNLKKNQNDINLIKNSKKIEKISVKIQGAVKNPGVYEIEKGKRLYDLIKLASGFREGANQEIKNYYLKNGQEFTIKYRSIIFVEILGEVKKPGKYKMYQKDQVYDLINKAGGITSFGIMPEKNYYLKDGMKFFIFKDKKQGEHQ
ncbi:MAG TPA: hypothetical protein DHW82_11810 [Spirochaetia bacterium]|nr:MAG: hypothetical protein A2Y41_14040 [Spirochaetes bacterium GWB1_36_13]HCL57677.1 hypothetical protein [Spirochaetia bacterium]